MLEKIFGQKSLAILYIISVCIIFVSLGFSFIGYYFSGNVTDEALINQIIFTTFVFLIITLPVFLQKFLYLYIPQMIEFSLCMYTVLLTYTNFINTGIVSTFLLYFLGSFILSLLVYSIFFSLLVHRKKSGNTARMGMWAVLFNFFFDTLLFLLQSFFFWFFLDLLGTSQRGFVYYLENFLFYESGIIFFSLVSVIFCLLQKEDYFLISGFRNNLQAEFHALKDQSPERMETIRNITSDTTDYTALLRKGKGIYFFLRLVYLAIYIFYLIFTSISVLSAGTSSEPVLISLSVSGLILQCTVYIYEYYLYRKKAPNRRLRILKIIRGLLRIHTLSLSLYMMVASVQSESLLSLFFSYCMLIMNIFILCVNITTVFKETGKSKKKTAEKRRIRSE